MVAESPEGLQPSQLAYRDAARGLFISHGNCLNLIGHLVRKYSQGIFDLTFADPSYSWPSKTCDNRESKAVISCP